MKSVECHAIRHYDGLFIDGLFLPERLVMLANLFDQETVEMTVLFHFGNRFPGNRSGSRGQAMRENIQRCEAARLG